MDSIFVPPQFGHVFVPIGIGSLQFAQTMMTSVE
jgi:oxalate decarboxylase/phosphoglucose isomerase-like protein (cupin superfamily)